MPMNKFILLLSLLPLTVDVAAQDTGKQLTKAYQQSAFSLFNAVTENQTGNVCFSPLSLQLALSMVQNGASGNTLQQLQQVLGTTDFNNEEIGDFNRTLSKSITERPPFDAHDWWQQEPDPQEAYNSCYPICEVANALWTRPDVELYDDFVEALRTYYDSATEPVEFSTWEGIGRINAWADEHTHGLIPKIYNQPQSSDLAVVLTNALYFKGSWVVPFNEEATSKQPFWIDDQTFVRADMMFLRDYVRCGATPSFRTITLRYGMEGDFSMTVFVPKEGTQLPELTYEEWSASRSGKAIPTNLQMPRFEIDGNYNLNDALQGLGMTDAFDGNADFSKMSKHPRAISNVRQLSKIIVDEKGTEAAAITIIEVPDGMGPDPDDFQDFNVDRPFYFTIQKADVVLFVGRVTQLPGTVEKVDGVAAVASHQDAGRCYDVQGRQLLRAPKKGFYIQDGQKRVAY